MMRLAKHIPYRGAGCLLHITDADGAIWVYLVRRRESFLQTARRETCEETRIDSNLLEPRSGDEWPCLSIWLPGFRWRTYLVGLDHRALRRLKKLRKAHRTSSTV